MRLFPLPWLKEEFHSSLTKHEVLQRLNAKVASTISWRDAFWGRTTAPFQGKISHDTFRIQRVIFSRNSHLPQITGHVASNPDHSGSIVVLCHRLRYFVLIINLLWLWGVGYVTVLTWLTAGVTSAFFWMVAGFFTLSVLLFTVPFWLEVRKSRPMLIKLLKLQAVAKR